MFDGCILWNRVNSNGKKIRGVSNANICVLYVSTQPLKTRFYTQTNHISNFVVTSLLWYTSYMTDVIYNEISANV